MEDICLVYSDGVMRWFIRCVHICIGCVHGQKRGSLCLFTRVLPVFVGESFHEWERIKYVSTCDRLDTFSFFCLLRNSASPPNYTSHPLWAVAVTSASPSFSDCWQVAPVLPTMARWTMPHCTCPSWWHHLLLCQASVLAPEHEHAQLEPTDNPVPNLASGIYSSICKHKQ